MLEIEKISESITDEAKITLLQVKIKDSLTSVGHIKEIFHNNKKKYILNIRIPSGFKERKFPLSIVTNTESMEKAKKRFEDLILSL